MVERRNTQSVARKVDGPAGKKSPLRSEAPHRTSNTPRSKVSVPADETSPKGQTVAIGAQMRIERRRLGLTLDALADATGLNKGYLSRIECGHKAPALATVLKLAKAFDISVGELLGEHLTAQTVRITRSGTGRQLLGKGDGFEMLVPGSTVLDAVIVRPDSDFGTERLREHAGEELIYILAGTVELTFPNKKVLLNSGDCARFPGHLRHRMRRIGRPVASALVVVVDLK
jgi:transcriptional regulator with XRE-family HTH domain